MATEQTPFADCPDVSQRLAQDAMERLGPVKPARGKLSQSRLTLRTKLDGTRLAAVSKALVYDRPLKTLNATQLKALVAMVLGGQIAVLRMPGSLPGQHTLSRPGADAGFHYLLRAK